MYIYIYVYIYIYIYHTRHKAIKRAPSPPLVDHARLIEPQSKVIFGRFCQVLAIDAHKVAPSTGQWLQVRVWDTPTKCLLWQACFGK
jgi:hypothetical protein